MLVPTGAIIKIAFQDEDEDCFDVIEFRGRTFRIHVI